VSEKARKGRRAGAEVRDEGAPDLRPKKGLGQHFLSDPGILRKIVEGAGVTAGERVLEIGPGPGGLTRALLAAQARVWAVEADPRMVAHLEGLALPGLQVWQGDALAEDYEALADGVGGPFRLVANLPYNISGPLLARLLRQRRAFTSFTVMLQREVAERLRAPPGTRARGSLGVLAQCFCRVSAVLRVAPGSFHPPPKVESLVLRLDLRPEPEAPVRDEDALWRVVRAGFGQRRKMLRNGLQALVPAPEPLLREVGLSGRERPEELTGAAWIALANVVSGVLEE
jgi:16S rRNA (adenine1518-N6/adenine1519-N6)-dimethyltransferase